jgi:hypothetical protein
MEENYVPEDVCEQCEPTINPLCTEECQKACPHIKKSIMLDKEDFELLLMIESHMESIKKTIKELLIMRGKLENAYHSVWTKIRQKYSFHETSEIIDKLMATMNINKHDK